MNGRRIADFPLPLDGLSNFTDISNIPIGMIEKVEVLSGSASAIYGSDAMAGVVNFVLKKDVEGVDYQLPLRHTDRGRWRRFASPSRCPPAYRATASTRRSDSSCSDQKPLWAFDRRSRTRPRTTRPRTRRSPAAISCASSRTTRCTSIRARPPATLCPASTRAQSAGARDRAGVRSTKSSMTGVTGHFCGSEESIGYGTILNSRRAPPVSPRFNYDLNDNTTLFADILVGVSKVETFKDVSPGITMDAQWQRGRHVLQRPGGRPRQLVPAVHARGNGRARTRHDPQRSDDDHHHARHQGHVRRQPVELRGLPQPQPVQGHGELAADRRRGRRTQLFLGPQTGVDEDSNSRRFDADPARLYTPLTRVGVRLHLGADGLPPRVAQRLRFVHGDERSSCSACPRVRWVLPPT